MTSTSRHRHALLGTALALGVLASGATAREGVRTIPLASVAPGDNRNVADPRPAVPESTKPAIALGRGELSVTIDRAKVIRLPEKTQTVIIGNPGVADISVQKNGVVVITGKSFGVTNVIALDATGGMIGESIVSVSAPSEATLTVQRGLDRQTYSCTPACHPSVALGDSGSFFSETKGQVDAHSAFVK